MGNELTLVSLAMLKVRIDAQQDYLEYIRPFVLDILGKDPPEAVTDGAVAHAILDRFGLRIPTRTVQIILRRLSGARVLTSEAGLYEVNGPLPSTDLDARRAEAKRHIAAVVAGLLDFDRANSMRLLGETDAFDALAAFVGNFSIACLRAYLQGSAIPGLDGEDWKSVLVSQYVSYLQAANPERFMSLIVLVQGNMVANALLCPDLHDAPRSYKDVTFYLDTSLLIQLLGLEGETPATAIRDLLALVRALDGKIACFGHTRDEVLSVIRGAVDYFGSSNARSKIVWLAQKTGWTKSDLVLLAAGLDKRLSDLDVMTSPTPRYDPMDQIDESVFAAILEGEIDYSNPRAKDFDVNSVRSVYTLRKGRQPKSLEKCGAVLVTDNTSFARAAYEFGKQSEESLEVSSVITDFSLANISWLKSPQQAPDLPRQEVIAYAYASMQAPDRFWVRTIAEYDRLLASGDITPIQHQLARSSYRIQDELMRLTLGDDAALTDASLLETVRRVTDELVAPEKEKVAALEQTLQTTRDESANNLETTSREYEVKLLETQRELESLRATNRKAADLICADCRDRAGRYALRCRSLLAGILIASSVGVYLVTSSWVRWLVTFVIAAFAVLQILEATGFVDLTGWQGRLSEYRYRRYIHRRKAELDALASRHS